MKPSFVVGKYTLESLTNGMYASPLDLYREYIQNAVDSIDEAVKMGLIEKQDISIEIVIDLDNNIIRIKDNGCGINKENAERLLIDIGNSKKDRCNNRGFRGIGRLAGLGYCDSLNFITTASGDAEKSTISFDAKRLKELLIPNNSDDSIYDVIDAVVSKKTTIEKKDLHYFEVVLYGIKKNSPLMNYEMVKEYLVQNAPLPFHPKFRWGHEVLNKVELAGYKMPEYNIYLVFGSQKEQLFKPYQDTIVSDRIRKYEDNICDINVVKLGDENDPLAIMWYASTNFYGTILDGAIKGLRIRQGNILIGNGTTCSQLFKEERFNGWVIGEIHSINNNLIANSRRDNFEQNESYIALSDRIKEIAANIVKELRKISHERSLSNDKQIIAQAENIDDVNSLCIEDMSYGDDVDEYSLMNTSENYMEAESDYIGKLSILLGQKNKKTKYMAINLKDDLTNEQRRVLEKVFDIIVEEYDEISSKKFINNIINNF